MLRYRQRFVGCRRLRQQAFCLASLFLLLLPVASAALPNIVVIITDDQRFDDLDDYMPVTTREIFERGARFPKAYVTTPACCPSRSSIFTGQYVSEHGVSGNRYVLNKKTFIETLKEKDLYYTGLIGKYLNSWNGEPRPEFDYWVSVAGGSVEYNDPPLNVNGNWQRVKGYSTELFRDYSLDFLEQATAQEKPFLLVIAFNAPHSAATPLESDTDLFLNSPGNTVPSFREVDRSDKPLWLQARPELSPAALKRQRNFRLKQRQCLASADRAVGAVLDKLASLDVLAETAIFFLSDNGILNGEHHLTSKDTAYEEAIRVPFSFRYDPLVNPEVNNALVANIDIAPTIYELAETEIPESVSGQSLLPLFGDSPPELFRDALLIEGFRGGVSRVPFAAVHTGTDVLVKNSSLYFGFDTNRYELYNLVADPYQLENRIHSKKPEVLAKKMQLRRRLSELLLRHRGTTKFRRPVNKKLKHRPLAPIGFRSQAHEVE